MIENLPPILVSHDLCPYVQRAAIAFAEKGAPFTRATIDLAAKPDWFAALSPLGKVPLLRVPQHGEPEAILFESNVICEWIEDTQPGPALHPANPTRRAQHRAWMEFASAILSGIYGLETTQDPTVFETRRTEVATKFARVEHALAEGPWFDGANFSLVDAAFAPVFRYFDTFDRLVDLGVFAATPKLRRWRADLAQRPSVQQAVGPDYPDLLHAFLVRHGAHLLQARRP